MRVITKINKNCRCPEGRKEDGELMAQVHNCKYVKARNKLIDKAYWDAVHYVDTGLCRVSLSAHFHWLMYERMEQFA